MTDSAPILFGAAYYDEYMPVDRLATDVAMLKAAHMNTVRIAESTWSTMEPRPGEFDFSHIDRVLDAMGGAGINVIVGTPTYAVPAWLVARHPGVLVRQHAGQRRYGPRQIMDIANADFRAAAERAIRALVSHVVDHPAVIGYQLDNETKYYDVLNDDVQRAFVADLHRRFDGDLDALNAAFGLDYWSNRIDDWDAFPDLSETINASLAGAFDRFRRRVVTDYLAWQGAIVREYAHDGQFVTQNHDMEWRGHSYGVQPWADHFDNARCLDVTGVDLYHPTESRLTGKEIAFGGDLTRCTKRGRGYLVLETQAQGQNGWMPYPGQLRLQAYSHLASGANAVMYWHWHSIHNSFETYWKGVLGHDFEPNPVYREAGVFGGEIERIGERLADLRKHNRVAIIVSNDALAALNRFTIETGFPKPLPYEEGDSSGLVAYNDVVRWLYDALYELNIEVDILPADHVAGVRGVGAQATGGASGEASGDSATGDDTDLESAIDAARLDGYDLIVAPALYCADQPLIDLLRGYVERGGHLLATCKSFVADRDVTVWHDRQPHGLADVFGIRVGEFTRPEPDVTLRFADDWIAERTGAVAGGGADDAAVGGAVDGAVDGAVGMDVTQGVEPDACGESARNAAAPHAAAAQQIDRHARATMDLIEPAAATTRVIASYDHAAWGRYAAVTRNGFGDGWAEWVGTMTSPELARALMRDAVLAAGIDADAMALAGQVTVRRGTNRQGRTITYLLNYSSAPVTLPSPLTGVNLLAGAAAGITTDTTTDTVADPAADIACQPVAQGEPLTIAPWGLAILES